MSSAAESSKSNEGFEKPGAPASSKSVRAILLPDGERPAKFIQILLLRGEKDSQGRYSWKPQYKQIEGVKNLGEVLIRVVILPRNNDYHLLVYTRSKSGGLQVNKHLTRDDQHCVRGTAMIAKSEYGSREAFDATDISSRKLGSDALKELLDAVQSELFD